MHAGPVTLPGTLYPPFMNFQGEERPDGIFNPYGGLPSRISDIPPQPSRPCPRGIPLTAVKAGAAAKKATVSLQLVKEKEAEGNLSSKEKEAGGNPSSGFSRSQKASWSRPGGAGMSTVSEATTDIVAIIGMHLSGTVTESLTAQSSRTRL